MKIKHYTSSKIYNRPELLKRVRFLTNGGWGRHPGGSGMLEDLEFGRKFDAWLVWEKGQVIAWAMVTQRKWGERPERFQCSIYVLPAFRRKGIGSKLITKARKFAASKDGVLVSKGWTNRGIKFYQKNKVEHTESWSYAFNEAIGPYN